uniref:Protein kinase APK1A n=1 Tax=Arundo donax TaxID=35708 RepID=A0A0A8YF54_ARUDO
MWSGAVDSPTTSNQLKQDNSEAIHIGLNCQLSCHSIFWCAITICSHHTCRYMRFVTNRTQLSKTKVRQLWVETLIQQNV